MAAMPADFYREEIRAGYRSPYFVSSLRPFSAELDPKAGHSDLPTPDLKKEMKKVKGVGDYVAENLQTCWPIRWFSSILASASFTRNTTRRKFLR
jgi:hypothetical protein